VSAPRAWDRGRRRGRTRWTFFSQTANPPIGTRSVSLSTRPGRRGPESSLFDLSLEGSTEGDDAGPGLDAGPRSRLATDAGRAASCDAFRWWAGESSALRHAEAVAGEADGRIPLTIVSAVRGVDVEQGALRCVAKVALGMVLHFDNTTTLLLAGRPKNPATHGLLSIRCGCAASVRDPPERKLAATPVLDDVPRPRPSRCAAGPDVTLGRAEEVPVVGERGAGAIRGTTPGAISADRDGRRPRVAAVLRLESAPPAAW
jgi:hypothetical protein